MFCVLSFSYVPNENLTRLYKFQPTHKCLISAQNSLGFKKVQNSRTLFEMLHAQTNLPEYVEI